MKNLQHTIEQAWENRTLLENNSTQDAIREIVSLLDTGTLRVAEPTSEGWRVNEWIKKAVVMYLLMAKLDYKLLP